MPPQAPIQATDSPKLHGVFRVAALAVVATLVLVGVCLWLASAIGYVWFAPLWGYEEEMYDSGYGAPDDLDMIIRGLGEVAATGSSSIPVVVETEGNVTNVYLDRDVRDGMYSLVGQGASQSGVYSGTVEIRHRTGNVYDLTWRIGGSQEQWGVGIFREGILSVGYYDQTGGSLQDTGVVSFVVQQGILEGEWTSLQGGGTGFEKLQWLSQ